MVKLYFERIFYYWRQSLFGHVHALCTRFLNEDGVAPLFIIWDALAYGAEGKTSTGLEKLEHIANRVAMRLPIAVAQLRLHKMAKFPDFGSITQLENEISEASKSANAEAVVNAAQIYWLTGDNDTAKELAKSLTNQSPANRNAAALTGWILLMSGDRNSIRWFEMASTNSATSSKIEPFVVYGKAMYYATLKRWQEAILALVELSADFPETAIDRARIYIATNNWDMAAETARETLGHCVSDAEIQLIFSLRCLTQIGNLDEARVAVRQLCDILQSLETGNASLILNIVRALSGLSWNDSQIVGRCLSLFEHFVHEDSENPSIYYMYGQLLNASKQYEMANQQYQEALIKNANCIAAQYGQASVLIAMGNLDEANDQLEFIKAMASPQDNQLELAVLQAEYQIATHQPLDIDTLERQMQKHVDSLQEVFMPQSARASIEIGLQIDHWLNNFLAIDMGILTKSLMVSLKSCNTLDGTVNDPQNGKICDIIARALEFIPGAVPFSYYLAILAFGEARYHQATKAITSVLQSNWGFNPSQCHLLQAQIRLQMKQFDEAEGSLNNAVAQDFKIRQTLRYNMIVAQLHDARGQYEKAVSTLRDLMKKSEYQNAGRSEKVDASLFLSRALRRMGQEAESLQEVEKALQQYQNTPDSDRILLFKAQLLAGIGRIRDGLDLLETIDIKSSIYTKAKKSAAKIYLNKLNDKGAYIRCFQQLTETAPTKANYVLLGDAMMKVKQFREAVNCFRTASQMDHKDEEVCLHLARALIIVHEFDQAITEYKRAIYVSHNDPKAQLECCRALVKLRRLDDARELAQDGLQNDSIEGADWESQLISADFCELLSQLEAKANDLEQSAAYLNEALSLYERLTAHERVDIPADSMAEVKKKASALYEKAAEIASSKDDSEAAVEALQHAIELEPGDPKALMALARQQKRMGKRDKCLETCQQILRIAPNCEDAALILAEVSSTESVDQLEAAYRASPTFYTTLVRLIEKCARAGEMERVSVLLTEQTEDEHPGMNFCRGLYYVHRGAPQKAIEQFSKVRHDPDWGQNAIQMMISIYSNPNKKYLWAETKPLAETKHLEAAKKMLNRLDPTSCDTEKFRALILISENTEASIAEALEIYKQYGDDDLDAALGQSKCYLRLGQQRNATVNLNGLIHGEPTNQNFNTLVEAFLIMTYISIKSELFDDAEEYIEKAISINRSCAKAWEMRAALYERRDEFSQAAAAYKEAWIISGKSNFPIGFKLALNYMKGNEPVEAIKVSRIILDTHPNYPKLKKAIFLPCVAALRT